MSTKAGVSLVNHADSGTVSASSEATGYPDDNLLTHIIGDVWRASNASPTLDIDLGAAKTIGIVALAAPRDGLMLAAADTWRLKFSASSAGGTDAGDTGAVATNIDQRFGYAVYIPAASITARYIQIVFSGSVSYAQFGRLWVGELFRNDYGTAPDWRLKWREGGGNTLNPNSLTRFPQAGQKAREAQLSLLALSASERDTVENGDIDAGASGQRCLVIDPSSPERTTIFGAMDLTESLQLGPAPRFGKVLSISEDT